MMILRHVPWLTVLLFGCTSGENGVELSNVDPTQCEAPTEAIVSCDQRAQSDLTGLSTCVEFRVYDPSFLSQLAFDCEQVAGAWSEEPCPVDDTLFGHCLNAGDTARVVAQYCYGEPSEVAEACLGICTLDDQGWCSGPGEQAYRGGCPTPEEDVGSCLYATPRDGDLPGVTSCWEVWGFSPSSEDITTPPPNYREDLKSGCEGNGNQWLDAPCPRPEDVIGQCTYDATAISPPNTWVFSGEASMEQLPCGGSWCSVDVKP